MHPHSDHEEVHSHHGTIRDVFGHRFVLATDDGPMLANIGSRAPDSVTLTPGAIVTISGKQTRSGVKVRLFQSGSGRTIEIPHKPKKDHSDEAHGDPTMAIKAALDAGYIVEGEPKRKPKHFVLQAIRGGRHYELHIMQNGDIRKETPLQN